MESTIDQASGSSGTCPRVAGAKGYGPTLPMHPATAAQNRNCMTTRNKATCRDRLREYGETILKMAVWYGSIVKCCLFIVMIVVGDTCSRAHVAKLPMLLLLSHSSSQQF